MLRLIYKRIYEFMEQKNVKYRFYDIAANLTDDQFGGVYNEKKHHEDDREEVINRARQIGCTHLLIAAGCISDALHSFQLCKKYENSSLTIGVHPCRANQPFNKDKFQSVASYFASLQSQLEKVKGKLVAIGQCGLDYDRLHYSSKEQQLQVFPYHFDLAEKYKLPMYLHNRNTGNDFYDLVRKNRDRFSTGVVHSFTGTKEEVEQIIDLDLYIGINGCSLKTKENLQILHSIPIQRIMLETDSPYCQIRNSHACSGMVKTKFPTKNKKVKDFLMKGRNQPCKIIEVLEVVSTELKIDPFQLSEIAFKNSMKLFHPHN